jgi:hypothetical protein
LCELLAIVAVGWLQVVGRLTTANDPAATSARKLTPKTASVVPPEDGRLTPETCTGLRHNKVFVKVKVYSVGYVIVIHGQQNMKNIK